MKTINASNAKTHFLEILRNIRQGGEEYIVTYKGEPSIRISPLKKQAKYTREEAIALIKKGIYKGKTTLAEIKEAAEYGRD